VCTELNEHAPTFSNSTPSSITVRWDLSHSSSSSLVAITATDADLGPTTGTVTYSLQQSAYPIPTGVSDGADVFQIDAASGQLSLAPSSSPLSQFSQNVSQFVLTIQASDGGVPARTAQHTLTVIPIPVPAFENGSIDTEIDEELKIGTVILDLSCREVGRSSGTTQVLLAGLYNQNFLMEKVMSVFHLVVARRMDYEQLPSAVATQGYVFTATCRNAYGESDNVTVRLAINNIDDNDFDFERDYYSTTVAENTTPGQQILSVSALDRDVPNVNISYYTNSTVFRFLSSSQNIIVLTEDLDREMVDRYPIALRADYNLSGVVSQANSLLVVTITDINDNAPMLAPSGYFVNDVTTRADKGDHVISVSATDADVGINSEITYSISHSQQFSINSSTGDITVEANLFPTTYKFTVYAEDNGAVPLTAETLVVVTVQPFPNALRLTIPESIVNEDVPIGSQIARAQVQVVDRSGVVINDTSQFDIDFDITNGSHPDTFIISRDTGEIFTLSTLDYDSIATSYNIPILAHLVQNPSVEVFGTAVVRVANIDDNPPRFMPQFYATVAEQFTPAGTSILQVTARDPDELAPIQFSLRTTSNVPFAVNSTTGLITAREELTTAIDYRFRVVARDGGTEESIAFVFVSITRPLSVSPVFTRSQFRFTLPENSRPGSHVGTVTALARNNISLDYFSHLGYRLSNPVNIDFSGTTLPMVNASNNLFHIDRTSGSISTQGNSEFDVERRMDFFFYVEVYNLDNNTIYDYATVEVELQDVNDNAPVFDQSLYTRVLTTAQPTGSVILSVSATDRDSGLNGRVTYSIENQGGGRVTGFALNVSSGALSVSNSTLIPGDHYITVIATDGGSPDLSDSTRVYVAVIPDIPETIEFTEPVYLFKLAEDATPPMTLGVVRVRGVNTTTGNPVNAMYSTPNVTNCFNLIATTGAIILTCTSIDREHISSYELTVRGRISSSAVALGTVRISILDVNDNPPDFLLDVYTKVIDSQFGNTMPVLQVQARDPDLGASGTVTYRMAPNSLYRIDSSSGELFLTNGTIEVGDYRLTVYADDMGAALQRSSSALVLICVTRAYPQSLNFQTTTLNISENEPEPFPVGTVELVTSGGNVVDPNDFPGNLVFSIVGGDAMDSFSIDASSGLLTALTRFDREESASHVVEILANFTQFSVIPLNHVQASFIVYVEDDNEAPAMDLIQYVDTIDDSAETGFVVANVSGTDSDAGLNAELYFSLVGGAPTSMFDVRVSHQSFSQAYGEIYVVNQSSLIAGTYSFDIIATDRGTPSLSSESSRVTIVIEHSIPDEIFFERAHYLFHTLETIGGNIITPVAVGNVSVIPKTPALDDLEYRISGGNGTRYFTVDSSGVISTSALLIDRETVSSFTLNITAHLPGSPFLYTETMVTISVDDLNDNDPIFDIDGNIYPRVGLSTDSLDLNSILNVSASDADTGSNAQIDYSIQSILFNHSTVLSDPLFMVNPRTGEVFVPFMNISIGTYSLTFRATDQGNPQRYGTAQVLVIVQQPAPQSLQFTQQNGYSFLLTENEAAGSPVGMITLQDFPQYLENRLRFTIANQGVPFTIVSSSGLIQNVRSINFEREQNFTFSVEVILDDSSRVPPLYLMANTAVTITIDDVNDNSPYFIDFPDLITQNEERPNPEVVHTILASDIDSGANGRLNYAILSTGIDDIVSINNQTGEITAAAGLDREDPRQGSDHSLIIQVCDSGIPSMCAQETVVFRLLDINDNSPVLTTGFTYNIVERTPFTTTAFTFRGSDPDEGNNGRLYYYFNHAIRSIPFWLSRGSGRVVYNYIEVDYETTPRFNISLNITDRGNPPRVTTYSNITFIVQDLPDSVPQFSEVSYRANINPAMNQNDPVAQVRATDADIPTSNDSLAYSIVGVTETGNRGIIPLFNINRTGGIFTTMAQVFWPEAQFEVTVLVYDQSRFNLSSRATVTVSVVPEPLAFTQAEYTAFVPEDLSRGSLVASLTIRNLSFSSDITYSAQPVNQQDSPGQFSTNGNGLRTVIVTLTSDLDREVVDMWQIQVTAQRTLPSRGREEATTILTIHVQDVNDHRPIFREVTDRVTVMEGVTQDTFVLRSDATDSDIGENGRLSYAFINEPAVFPFRINSSNGTITTSGKIDYETVSSYNITVLARDHGVPARENHVSYTIEVVNINDNHPRFAKPAYFGEVYAKAPVDSLVSHTQFIVSDLDDLPGQEPLTFNIRQGLNVDSSYRFEVTTDRPHRIMVKNIPASADDESDLLTFIVEVTDVGGLIAEVPLYLSIFTSQNLIPFVLEGNINFATLQSCIVDVTSLCLFRDTVASITRTELGTFRGITFYNNSATEVVQNGARRYFITHS